VLYPSSKSTGTSYTGTVALLGVALLFIPALVLFAGPVAYSTLYGAIVGSAAFVGLAWANWRRNSRLSIPTITSAGGR
jgi:hypothetical protein